MDRYQEWDVTIPPLPPRSRLYRLEPIGRGTPYVESLTSYVARLAAEHHVMPKYLVMEEIIPLQGHLTATPEFFFQVNKIWRQDAFTLNGVSAAAEQWVETLQTLTSCENLRFLTMLTWKRVVTTDSLLRLSKAWCPLCYEEWRCTPQFIYDPLLWMFNSVNICSRHLQPLVTLCRYCLKIQPHLTQQARLGYCCWCERWLGCAPGATATEVIHADLEKPLWIAKVVGELISATPELPAPPQKEQIAMMLEACLDKYSKGSIFALARLTKISANRLWYYLRRGAVPRFDTFLNFCSNLSITPLEFLTASSLPSSEGPNFTLDHVTPRIQNKGKLTEDEVQRVRQVLESLLAERADPPPTLEEIAQRLGHKVETLQRYFPDLCRAITTRVKRNYSDDETLARMRQILENALASDEPIPLNAIASQFGYPSKTLQRYFPDLCQAVVKKYRDRFSGERWKFEQVRRRLEEVLSSDEDVISVKELARLMGYKYQTLRNHFPDLCKKISERYRVELSRRRKERLANDCARIRQAMLLLHERGIYPSRDQVGKLLDNLADIHLLRLPEGQEIWKETLRELGYTGVNTR